MLSLQLDYDDRLSGNYSVFYEIHCGLRLGAIQSDCSLGGVQTKKEVAGRA
jgi:hypothetical protein